MTDLLIRDNKVTGVKTEDGNIFEADAVILATGHSARDIFQDRFGTLPGILYYKNSTYSRCIRKPLQNDPVSHSFRKQGLS